MKIRQGFVSNSSASSFIVTNKTNKFLSMKDLGKELVDAIMRFIVEYEYEVPHDMTLNKYVEQIVDKLDDEPFFQAGSFPHDFGDNYGVQGMLGATIDYMLRNTTTETDNFILKFTGFNR